MLIKLTKRNGDEFYLNADKIISVIPHYVFPPSSAEEPDPEGVVEGSTIYHEPYNSENECDWENVKELPDQIAEMSTLCAYVK